VAIGAAIKPFGARGAVAIEPYNAERNPLTAGLRILIGGAPMQVESVRPHARGRVVARFKGVDGVDAAERLRGLEIFVPEDALPALEDGRYYHYQLLGCEVGDGAGRVLGRLTEIIANAAGNDVYVIKSASGAELLAPATADAIAAVDLDAKTITVDRDFCVSQTVN